MKWGMMGVFVGLVVLFIWLPERVIQQKPKPIAMDFIIKYVRLYDGETTFEKLMC